MRTAVIALCALLLGALTAVLLAACGTSAFSHVPSIKTGTGIQRRPVRASVTSITSTAKTATQRQVTTVASTSTTTTSTTTTSTTTTSPQSRLPGYNHPVVQLGDMNNSEQFILGSLYSITLSHEGYTVVLNRNIGETAISQAALAQGSLMVYPQYLNVWDRQVAGEDARFKSLNAAYRAGERYARSKGWELLRPTPFSDTVGVAVSAQYAHLNHLHTLAQLSRGPKITLGWPPEAGAAQTALSALESGYGFKPGSEQPIDIGTQYSALAAGTFQASYASTTDPQLTLPGFVLLTDPKHVFGFGNVVPVTTRAVIAREGPAFAQTLNRVDALLTQSAIRGLTYEVAIEHLNPATVAQQFLQGNGLIPATVYAPVPTATVPTSTADGTSVASTSTSTSAR